MFFKIALIVVMSVVLPIVTASKTVTTGTNEVTILPEDCQMLAGEEMPLALAGSIPSSAVVTWNVDYGGIGAIFPGKSAVLVAPYTPVVVTVSVTIWPDQAGPEIIITRQCIVSRSDNTSGYRPA